MDKITKRKPVDRKKTEAVHWVARKEGVTTVYVYGVLNGTFTNGRSEIILKLFRDKYAELKQVLS